MNKDTFTIHDLINRILEIIKEVDRDDIENINIINSLSNLENEIKQFIESKCLIQKGLCISNIVWMNAIPILKDHFENIKKCIETAPKPIL